MRAMACWLVLALAGCSSAGAPDGNGASATEPTGQGSPGESRADAGDEADSAVDGAPDAATEEPDSHAPSDAAVTADASRLADAQSAPDAARCVVNNQCAPGQCGKKPMCDVFIDCGGCATGLTCGAEFQCTCVPSKAACPSNAHCGMAPDGCGGQIDCSPPGYHCGICQNFQCQ